MRCDHIDIVDAVAEIGDQLNLALGLLEQLFVDQVGDGGHQDIGRTHGIGDLLVGQRRIVEIELRVEQLAHAGLDRVRQFARDDNERLFLNSRMRVSIESGSLRVTTTRGFFLTDMSCSREAVQTSLTRLFETAIAAQSRRLLGGLL